MDSSTYNTSNIERDCNLLGGLFQQIIGDMRASSPIWDDFLSKATKLHAALRTTLVATSAFLDAFQKVADMATNTKGATKEMGSSLTRLCIRHRSIEKKLKDFTNAILEVMVLPLQDKKEEWKTRIMQIDKEHAKEKKRAHTEIKKASSESLRLQKKIKKGKGDTQLQLSSALQEVTDKYLLFEECEKTAVRQALMEQRNQFCQFLYNFKPVIDGEISMMSEMTHIQEILDTLCLQAGDPNTLPPASEQVIQDLKGSTQSSFTNYQTPPSSPSSLGSRKSSMCSINSLNSNSSGSIQNQSPSHHSRHRPTSQFFTFKKRNKMPLPQSAAIRLSSVSSQDSGFTSQDALYLKPPSPSLLDFRRKSAAYSGTGSSGLGSDSGGTTPSPSYPFPSSSAVSTWANWPDPPYIHKQEISASGDRPHTISSAYERSHSRPAINADTFEAPQMAPGTQNPYAVPCVQVQNRNGRPPSLPPPPLLGPRSRSKAVATPVIPELRRSIDLQRKSLGMSHVYVNTQNLAIIPGGAEEGSEDDDDDEDDPSDFMELSAAMHHLNSCTAALEDSLTDPDTSAPPGNRLSVQCSSGYGTMSSTPTCSEDTLGPDDKTPEQECLDTTLTPTVEEQTGKGFEKFSTMPRTRCNEASPYQVPIIHRRPLSMTGIPTPPPSLLRSTSQATGTALLRRKSALAASPLIPPNVPRLPGHDGKNLRESQSESSIVQNCDDKSDLTPTTDGRPESEPQSEYVNFMIAEDSDNDSVDDLPLPPPPDEMIDEMEIARNQVKRGNSIAEKHCDIMNVLNEKLMQPIYAVPQTINNTPPSSLPCQAQPIYTSPSGSTTPVYATPYAQPSPIAQHTLPIDSPDSSDDITPTADLPPPVSFLTQIKRGVSLRRTISRDRSAPLLNK